MSENIPENTDHRPQKPTTQSVSNEVERPRFTQEPVPKKRNLSLFYKIGAIALLTIGFLVGMQLINSLVNERERYQNQVIGDIKRMHTREQQVVTPIMIVPQTRKYPCTEKQEYATGKFKEVTKTCTYKQLTHIVPASSLWNNRVDVSNDNYKRSIYRAISFDDKLSIDTHFELSDTKLKDYTTNAGSNLEDSRVTHWNQAKIILPISDLRGLNDPELSYDAQTYRFVYPEKEEYLGLSYVQSALPNISFGKKLNIKISANISGISALSAVPLGKSFSMGMETNWPHPQFFGNALPSKNITSTGFKANWNNSYNSVANTQKLNECAKDLYEKCSLFNSTNINRHYTSSHDSYAGFGVQFVNAADTYTFTDRTIKYALLLLMVVFGAFFLFEVTKNLRIHPIQYSLVGAALLVFYVLLLSLSEQIDFSIAYLSAAVACVSLMGWYVYYVLQSMGRAALFTTILAALYASFYFIIQSEDNSLIMGSVFMFVLLAAVMFFTRHIDWYEKT